MVTKALSCKTYWLPDRTYSTSKVPVFGPVLDPNGVNGLGIVEADNEEQVKSMIANDPANGLNKYEYYLVKAVTPKNNFTTIIDF